MFLVKKWIFYGQADRKRLPPPPPTHSLCSMCSEADFTQEKSHFDPTPSIPNSSLLFAAALSHHHQMAV